MVKVDAPIAGGKAFMWEGFGSVANNNITTPIKPLCRGEDHCFNLLCRVKKKQKKRRNHTITRVDIRLHNLPPMHGNISS